MGCSQGKTTEATSSERCRQHSQVPLRLKMQRAKADATASRLWEQSTSAEPSRTLLDIRHDQTQKVKAEKPHFQTQKVKAFRSLSWLEPNSSSSSSAVPSPAHVNESCGQRTVDLLGQIDAMREFKNSASPNQVTPEALLAWVRDFHGGVLPRSAPQSASSTNCPLRVTAMRVFAMADKGADGLLDPTELLKDSCDTAFVKMLQNDLLDGNGASSLACSEWLEIVRKAALRDMVQTALFLDLCQQHAGTRLEHFGLRSKALDVFRMGDRNGDGQLDMNELTEIRQSAHFATAMMDNVDIDKSGAVSKGEWLAYVKRLADKNEKSAAAVLALYMKHLDNSIIDIDSCNTAEVCLATKVNVLLEKSSIRPAGQWWACY